MVRIAVVDAPHPSKFQARFREEPLQGCGDGTMLWLQAAGGQTLNLNP